jgi:hypothetical protein
MGEVKANKTKLDNCRGPHEFELTQPDNAFSKRRCKRCGGTVDGTAAFWYLKGLQHGRTR